MQDDQRRFTEALTPLAHVSASRRATLSMTFRRLREVAEQAQADKSQHDEARH